MKIQILITKFGMDAIDSGWRAIAARHAVTGIEGKIFRSAPVRSKSLSGAESFAYPFLDIGNLAPRNAENDPVIKIVSFIFSLVPYLPANLSKVSERSILELASPVSFN